MSSPSPAWSPSDVLSELNALAASESFRRAPGQIGLLRFLVETELRGEGDTLKEILIGTIVYRRDADYDPKTDGIVRVNANRLRTRLLDHYRQSPSQIQIGLRAGSYRPQFEVVIPDPPAEEPTSPVVPPQSPLTVRSGSWGWLAAAALLVLLACTLFWKLHSSQPRWSEQALSRMTGLQSFADFSPDNRHIAYAVEDTAANTSWLYLQDIAGSTPTKLSTADRYETRPAWSPDGNSLAFVVSDENKLRILVRSLQGNAETEIFSRAHSGPWLCDVPRISWNADGSEIITVAPPTPEELASGKAPSAGCGVVAINARTHAVRRITWSPAKNQGDLEPTVSPDGKTIAFLRETSYAMVDVTLVGIDGNSLRSTPLKGEDIQGIAWTPDGQALLLCMRYKSEQIHLVRFDPASGKIRSEQDSAAPMAFPTVARDGRHIVFTEYHQTNKVFRLQNSGLTDIFADGVLRANAAASPDGKLLAYSSDRTGRNQIWISDSSGRSERIFTATGGAGANRPAWSADGKSILYECREGTVSNLCVQSLSGGKATMLVQMGSDAILPSLSTDGTRLYFTSNASGMYEGYRQHLRLSAPGVLSADGKPERLTTGGAVFLFESRSGKTLYLRGGDPTLILANMPVDLPVPFLTAKQMDPKYQLKEPAAHGENNTVVGEGLVLLQPEPGAYHFLLYREGSKSPTKIFTPQPLDPIDGASWEAARNSLLLTTRSKPTGTLRLLSNN